MSWHWAKSCRRGCGCIPRIFYAIDTPKMKQFIDMYRKITKQYPTCMAILNYDSVMALAGRDQEGRRF